jgi:MFS family permease
VKPISHLQLTRKASFGVSAGVVAHTLWSSAAPALTYRLYAEQWQLSHVVTTGIFAIYPFAVVLTLVMFGDLSDRIGRRANMLYGLGASILGTLLFALAQNALWLFAARFTMGIGVGLTAGAATAAMLDFAKPGRESATASIAAVAQAAGFAAALVMAGLLIEFAPFPTTLNFWLLFAVLIVLLVATMLLPRPALATQPVAWSPSLPYVPKAQRRAFMVAALTVATAYSHGVLILSIGGQVVHDLIGSSSALINGVALALFPIAGGMVGVLGRSIRPFIASAAGALVSSAAMLLLVLAVHHQSLTTLLIATTAAGVGYSLLFSGGLGMVNLIAPAAHRGSMLSGLYLFGYLAMGLVALAIGVIATWFGLRLAVNLGAITISLMGFASLFGGLRLNQATATLNLRSFDKVVPAPPRIAAGTFNNHS